MIMRMPYHVTVPGVTRTLFNTHCILLFILLTPPLRGITVRLVAAISTGKHGAGAGRDTTLGMCAYATKGRNPAFVPPSAKDAGRGEL